MDDFRLDTFADGSLVDDLVLGAGRIAVELVGDARYQLSAVCDSGRQVTVDLWTTKKETITTRLRDVAAWATVRLAADGNLEELTAAGCSLHLEHMDRGHYWLGLDNATGDPIHVDFLARGYLRTQVTKNVVPTPPAKHA